jgi:hypothetical protein
MKKINLLFILFGFLCGCSTDFDTVAPWKEIMVVYGLLNPNDNIQYIRVSKAFLGEGNALVMAQQPDSIYYGNVLTVKIEHFLNGTLTDSDTLSLVDSADVPKESGTFSAPYQQVYAYTKPIPDLTTTNGSSYKLTITNRVTGNVVTASTEMIEELSISLPYTNYVANFAGSVSSLTWKMHPSEFGKIYGITQYINYLETDTNTNITVAKSVKWYLGDKLATDNLNSYVTFPFSKSDFYRLLGDNIEPNPVMKRSLAPEPFDIYVSSGTEELYTYMQVTNENTGIVQDKPLYSNIVNGIGLFTCRNTRKISIQLHGDTYAALDTSVYTKDLNF